MARRKLPEINASSNADIAFLLLIFFLVTTTMDVDTGIARKLPPPPVNDQEEEIDINQRNIFNVMINKSDLMLVRNKPGNIDLLKEQAKEFLANPYNKVDLPGKKLVEIEGMPDGTYMVSKGVISLKNDRGTSYNMYIQVQDQLAAAVNELRDELAKELFGMSMSELENDEVKYNAIQKAVPMAISEAEPENIGGK